MHFCIDYRKLNAVTHKDVYLLPCNDDTLDVLSGSLWFNTIDPLSGYWQVGIAEKDKEKTAFTKKGCLSLMLCPLISATPQQLFSCMAHT